MHLHLFGAGRRSFARIIFTSLLAFAFLAQSATSALALGGVTGVINGTVTDQAGKPLTGVTVAAVSPTSAGRTKTDAKGFYSIIGLPVDTYTVSFDVPGYEPSAFTGVTVQGDQTVTVDSPMRKSLITIGKITTRSPSAAYQPKQTLDSYQISGSAAKAALGKSFNISQTQLMQSLPSIVNTVYGSSSIRGSTRTELAYQFEGIDYTDPLSNQFQNSLGLNGVQALQVNPGAGDASQGNAGGGAINLTIKRGSRPAFGTLDLEASNYPFVHQAAFDYGWATPNGRFSNYSSFLAQDQYRTYGDRGTPALQQGTFLSTDYVVSRDFVNNFIYKFGKDNSQSLQFLYQTRFSDFFINHGGISNLCYKTCDPQVVGTTGTSVASATTVAGSPTLSGSLLSGTYFAGGSNSTRAADFLQIIGLNPGQSAAIQPLPYYGFNHQPVDVFKLEHDGTWGGGVFTQTRLYRTIGNAQFNRPYDTTSGTSWRVNLAQGGWRDGINGDIFKQAGDKNLVSLSYLYQGSYNVYDYENPAAGFRSLTPVLNQTGGAPATCPNNPSSANLGSCAGGYEIADFITAGQNITLPSGAVATTFCPGTDPFGVPIVASATAPNRCGYLAQFFGGVAPRVPNFQEPSSGFQQAYGFGLRDQITISNRLKLDLGLRFDGANYHLIGAQNTLQFQQGLFTRAVTNPTSLQPRAAFAYQLSKNDAIRASFGRSVEFVPGGIINSPVLTLNQFSTVPSYDNHTGGPALFCGPLQNQACANYAQQLHDEHVNFFNGPEAFAVKPATYTNYDASYSHQFPGNVGMKISPFFKRGYDVPVFSASPIGTDPISGLPIFGPSILKNSGVDKTTGVEFYVTRDVPYGLGGFVALTYVNRLQNIPPGYLGQTEDFYPSAPAQSVALGSLYRAGYLSPIAGRLGLVYKTRGGLRVNPIFQYDKGYPIGAGLTAPVFINGVPSVIPNTNATLPNGFPVALGQAASTSNQFISPTNPGSLYSPNVVATRGTPEGNSAGGILSKARVFTDISFEYSVPNSHSTFGMYVSNVFNNIYAEPSLNTRWQPVATGVPGPQTGQTTGAFYGIPGFFNFAGSALKNPTQPFILTPSLAPTQFRFYFQQSI
ncbi:MAG: TonB-dependent receptor [Candidatus Eremiobacteraeota bacterium]|nr:TonB-dependent receptor [Candidatus Eremiobacteraeota bacterium]